ncbi:MAG: response regulator [Methanolobus sp.]|uniref:response regulator n=1 Tax=Methanolobus sp. TaxID=1874737 RepID=UPI0027308098|nr:response regulator [Methanolobus sp.]MDP2218457.1 response regulator [Methanolobus sp.]
MQNKEKVLIVDDEQAIVELMGLYLRSEYDVISAYNGQEALERIKTDKPDIVLLDVMMPDMNGYEVCRRLKTSVETQFLPVIMVTALSGKDDRIKGIEVGADEFLGKPVNRLELVTRVRSLLRIKHLQDKILAERNDAMNYLDAAGFIVIVIDPEMRVNLINRKGNETLGYEEFELIGQDFVKVVVREDMIADVRASLEAALTGTSKLPDYWEIPVVRKDGRHITVRWYDTLLNGSDGEVTGLICSGEDLSIFDE